MDFQHWPDRLESDRLVLRLFEPSDARALKRVRDESRDHLTRALGWGPERFGSLAEVEAEIGQLRENHAAHRNLPLGIFAKADGALLGAVGLVRPDWEAGRCELGIWLGAAATGQGVASEAARRLARHAFEALGLRCLEIKADPANAVVRGAAERHGFTFEGLKAVEPGKEGPLSEIAIYTLTARQFLGPLEIRPLSRAAYDQAWSELGPQVFAGVPRAFRYQDALTPAELEREAALRERLGDPHRLYLGAFAGDRLVGWTWGLQESAETFYMVNSAVLPAFRGQGIYAALLERLLQEVRALGFQRIYSRHTATNNAVIIPKLKAGFTITALELSDRYGALVHLTYFPHETRRKMLDFRAGQRALDDEIQAFLGQGG